MKSVGEVMAIGTTFPEALQKALRGLEIGTAGLVAPRSGSVVLESGTAALQHATPGRLFAAADALRSGQSVEQVALATGYDRWFVEQLAGIVMLEQAIAATSLEALSKQLLLQAKQAGFSDARIAALLQPGPDRPDELAVRRQRIQQGVRPVYHRIDTCAAEFEARTPYLYSTYATRDESETTTRPKVIILGGGPNRIGQGIEFDYCCVHACFALSDLGYETIMINSNPETVSTDYDTADRLYFEPLTFEHVMNVIDTEKPDGVLVQFGGQTPLNIAQQLHDAGAPIWGTSIESINIAEDRQSFNAFLTELDIP